MAPSPLPIARMNRTPPPSLPFGCPACRALPTSIQELQAKFLMVRAYFDQSHDHFYLRRCKACDQYYLEQFHEIVDWTGSRGRDDMWSYWAPITAIEQRALDDRFSDGDADRSGLSVLHKIMHSRPRLTYDADNVFSWSPTTWTASDLLPPG